VAGPPPNPPSSHALSIAPSKLAFGSSSTTTVGVACAAEMRRWQRNGDDSGRRPARVWGRARGLLRPSAPSRTSIWWDARSIFPSASHSSHAHQVLVFLSHQFRPSRRWLLSPACWERAHVGIVMREEAAAVGRGITDVPSAVKPLLGPAHRGDPVRWRPPLSVPWLVSRC